MAGKEKKKEDSRKKKKKEKKREAVGCSNGGHVKKNKLKVCSMSRQMYVKGSIGETRVELLLMKSIQWVELKWKRRLTM